MNVELYVYDLTRGMARAMSRQFLGIQIDAVYHTSLVFNNREVYFGAGIQESRPGATHHGAPMERITLGVTHLPQETINEYLENMKQVYSAASYDLFEHNCNNFTNDFGMFLVGKGIPEHITGLPRRVLDTPFGAMLRPQIDASMRSITQAPAAPQQPSTLTPVRKVPYSNVKSVTRSRSPYGTVVDVTSLSVLEERLRAAKDTASTIFFTSSTCAPCRIAYPTYDSLAEQNPESLFVKVDINAAQDIASRYQIRATPTFATFAKGVKLDEWSGADPAVLRANVDVLLLTVYPPHAHDQLDVPTLRFGSMKPVTYGKIPPLDRLMSKLGPAAQDEVLVVLKNFLSARHVDPTAAALPDLAAVARYFQNRVPHLPIDAQFAAVDLLRCAMIDSRVSTFFAEEDSPSTFVVLVQHVNKLRVCPHNLRLVTLHLACNIFSSPRFLEEILMTVPNQINCTIVQLITSSLLDVTHSTTRVAASTLAFNLAVFNYLDRRELNDDDAVPISEQVELAVALLHTLPGEESAEARRLQLLSLGYLLYFAPPNSGLISLCETLDARDTVAALVGKERLALEVGKLL